MGDKPWDERLSGFDLLSAPGHLLRRNHQRSYDIFVRLVGDDVTRQQIAVLIELAKNSGCSQRDLVERTGIDKSTLKEMLGRMVDRGWVERERDQSDSRAWSMRITDSGGTLLVDRLPKLEAASREIVEPLCEDDRAHFMRCLRILAGIDK